MRGTRDTRLPLPLTPLRREAAKRVVDSSMSVRLHALVAAAVALTAYAPDSRADEPYYLGIVLRAGAPCHIRVYVPPVGEVPPVVERLLKPGESVVLPMPPGGLMWQHTNGTWETDWTPLVHVSNPIHYKRMLPGAPRVVWAEFRN